MKDRVAINIPRKTYDILMKLAENASKELGTNITVPKVVDIIASEKLKSLET